MSSATWYSYCYVPEHLKFKGFIGNNTQVPHTLRASLRRSAYVLQRVLPAPLLGPYMLIHAPVGLQYQGVEVHVEYADLLRVVRSLCGAGLLPPI